MIATNGRGFPGGTWLYVSGMFHAFRVRASRKPNGRCHGEASFAKAGGRLSVGPRIHYSGPPTQIFDPESVRCPASDSSRAGHGSTREEMPNMALPIRQGVAHQGRPLLIREGPCSSGQAPRAKFYMKKWILFSGQLEEMSISKPEDLSEVAAAIVPLIADITRAIMEVAESYGGPRPH